MQPAEYLQWLRDVERGQHIGDEVRAYLVSRHTLDGSRTLTPVRDDQSVMNIERDLFNHLEARSPEFFERLLLVCVERLGVTHPVDLPGDLGERARVGFEAAAACDEFMPMLTSDLSEMGIRVFAKHLSNLCAAAMDALHSSYGGTTVAVLRRSIGLEASHE